MPITVNIKSLNPLYYFVTIFASSSIIISWVIFYSKHNLFPIKTISETVNSFPQSRIFVIGMNITAFVGFILFSLRQKIIRSCMNKKSILLSITSCMIPVICISLATIANVTLKDHFYIYIHSANVFFLTILIYFIITDILARKAGIKVKSFSFALPYILFLIAISYLILIQVFRKSKRMYSLGAVFQYITVFSLFLKNPSY